MLSVKCKMKKKKREGEQSQLHFFFFNTIIHGWWCDGVIGGGNWDLIFFCLWLLCVNLNESFVGSDFFLMHTISTSTITTNNSSKHCSKPLIFGHQILPIALQGRLYYMIAINSCFILSNISVKLFEPKCLWL